MLRLKTLDLKGEKFFRVYNDADVIAGLHKYDKQGRETLQDSTQDDDLESDEGVMQSGVQTSMGDLLVVKDYLKLNPERVYRSLRAYKLWAPLFNDRLPYKVQQ